MDRLMGTPIRLTVDSSAAPLAMEFGPHGSAVYLRLSDEPTVRTTEIEDGALADYDANGALVGLEILGLEDPAFVRVWERVKKRFVAEAPALASIEAVTA